MFDNAVFLAGTYAAMAAGLSLAMTKFSPTIGPRLRHLFSGAAPLAAVLAERMNGADSITLYGTDLVAAGGLVILGVATSTAVGKLLPTPRAPRRPQITR